EVVGPARASADLHLYHLGNSPAHAYAYRAARARAGVAFLHEWSLHHLVLHETVERGDVFAYLREMRRAHGETGSFVARQVARGLGGKLLPAMLPLNDRVLEASLAVVTLTREAAGRARRRISPRPVLALPMHFACPFDPAPSREEARRDLGLPADTLLVVAPGLCTAAKRVDLVARAVGRLRERDPRVRLAVAGAVDPASGVHEAAHAAGLGDAFLVTGRLHLSSFVRWIAAADVVAALRFPSHGEMSAALVRALGLGRPALVSAGTPAGDELPEGVVVPVTPGPAEEDELLALLGRLLGDEALRARISGFAREHVRAGHDLASTTDLLAGFLRTVEARQEELRSAADVETEEGTLPAFFREEVRWAARNAGLPGFPFERTLFSDLAGRRH
ncbi:MAG TPA: glycosyltransferase, partial [Vicinamibacteria bacterium]|nr:glycosyltransferase [Vicinamibacteria bacterium]